MCVQLVPINDWYGGGGLKSRFFARESHNFVSHFSGRDHQAMPIMETVIHFFVFIYFVDIVSPMSFYSF